LYFIEDVYKMLLWFGVPESTVEKVRKSGGVASEMDINVDEDHPPERALDVDNVKMLKPYCSAQAWEKVHSAYTYVI
jgi:hypothetical protein